jgi:hypothetical protein
MRSIHALGAALVLASSLALAAEPLPDDVGDKDSYRRPVLHLGFATTKTVGMRADCSDSDPTAEVCLPTPAGDVPFDFVEPQLGTYTLLPKATNSLLCFDFTPMVNVSYRNEGSTARSAQLVASMTLTLRNTVLDNPSLVDPDTGLPYGGRITIGLAAFRELFILDAGRGESRQSSNSRHCTNGLVSRRQLIERYGLNESQAAEFFTKQTRITLGATLHTRSVANLQLTYGIRFYGD